MTTPRIVHTVHFIDGFGVDGDIVGVGASAAGHGALMGWVQESAAASSRLQASRMVHGEALRTYGLPGGPLSRNSCHVVAGISARSAVVRPLTLQTTSGLKAGWRRVNSSRPMRSFDWNLPVFTSIAHLPQDIPAGIVANAKL